MSTCNLLREPDKWYDIENYQYQGVSLRALGTLKITSPFPLWQDIAEHALNFLV